MIAFAHLANMNPSNQKEKNGDCNCGHQLTKIILIEKRFTEKIKLGKIRWIQNTHTQSTSQNSNETTAIYVYWLLQWNRIGKFEKSRFCVSPPLEYIVFAAALVVEFLQCFCVSSAHFVVKIHIQVNFFVLFFVCAYTYIFYFHFSFRCVHMTKFKNVQPFFLVKTKRMNLRKYILNSE